LRESIEQYPLHFEIVSQVIVPDESKPLTDAILTQLKQVDLILTSGGTGFTERDITPDVTAKLITKKADSLTIYMISEAVKIAPLAALSRAIIG
jgi:gephyrin